MKKIDWEKVGIKIISTIIALVLIALGALGVIIGIILNLVKQS